MTSPSPPDISSLTLSPQRSQQRPNENYDMYDGRTPYHFQTSPPIIPGGAQPFNTSQVSPTSVKKGSRAGLPSQWLDNAATPSSDTRPLSPPQSSDISSGGSPPMGHQLPQSMPGQQQQQQFGDDEVIPTAIVIKNIPFNVKRETLLDII
ncbi:hypothetical protein M422DRAFT_263154, partial [Sphaerobolus stellatus SS14]